MRQIGREAHDQSHKHRYEGNTPHYAILARTYVLRLFSATSSRIFESWFPLYLDPVSTTGVPVRTEISAYSVTIRNKKRDRMIGFLPECRLSK